MTSFAREELQRLRPGSFTALTIGNFDGVHRGHRFLFRHLIGRARALGLKAGAITLYPNPLRVLRPEVPIYYLTSLEERIELMRACGLDFVAPLTFTSEVAALTAEEFARMLYDDVSMRLLLMGPDNSFGRDREGTPERMTLLGDRLGFAVEQLPEHFLTGSQAVHASSIREALLAGDMDAVAEQLGRPYSLAGPVIHGEHRGRQLGFPTANMAVAPDRFLPAFGVYATWAWLGQDRYAAATNIGRLPHFGAGKTTVETYIMDFDENIYGRHLKIELVTRISPEEAFTTLDALKTKIENDVSKAREILTSKAAGPSPEAIRRSEKLQG
jgi:riboflavin kinase/FMN adenylyltransferase